MRRLFIVYTLVYIVKIATAQVSATATVDSTTMLIGDQLRLHIEVNQPRGVQLRPLKPGVSDNSAIEFLAESQWDTLQSSGNMLRLRKDLVFTAWDSGFQRVPPITLLFLQNGTLDSTVTNDIPMRVEIPATDTTLADIKPIIAEPAKWQDYLPYLLGILVILAFTLLVWYINKRKIKQRTPLPPPPPVILPFHETALHKLELLKKQQLWQSGRVKEYHSELTHILREYLENRFNIQALEQTTDEILEQLRKSDFDQALSEKLASLLQTADLVKFAKAQPPANFHDRAMTYVEKFILETRPVFIPKEPTEK